MRIHIRDKFRKLLPFITILIFGLSLVGYYSLLNNITADSQATNLDIAKSCVTAAASEVDSHYDAGITFLVGLRSFVKTCDAGPNVYAELFDNNNDVVQQNSSDGDTISGLDNFTLRYGDSFFYYAHEHSEGTYAINFDQGKRLEVYFKWIPTNSPDGERYLMVAGKADVFQYQYLPSLLLFAPVILIIGIVLAYLQFFTLKEQKRKILQES